jgi:hypothetical protein
VEIGILYEDAVRPELMRGIFKEIRITGVPMEGQLYIIMENRTLSPAAQVFLKLLHNYTNRNNHLCIYANNVTRARA